MHQKGCSRSRTASYTVRGRAQPLDACIDNTYLGVCGTDTEFAKNNRSPRSSSALVALAPVELPRADTDAPAAVAIACVPAFGTQRHIGSWDIGIS